MTHNFFDDNEKPYFNHPEFDTGCKYNDSKYNNNESINYTITNLGSYSLDGIEEYIGIKHGSLEDGIIKDSEQPTKDIGVHCPIKEFKKFIASNRYPIFYYHKKTVSINKLFIYNETLFLSLLTKIFAGVWLYDLSNEDYIKVISSIKIELIDDYNNEYNTNETLSEEYKVNINKENLSYITFITILIKNIRLNKKSNTIFPTDF